MGLLPLTYTRPKHVDQQTWRTSTQSEHSAVSDNEKSDGSIKSGQSGQSSGIPESLAFDKIMNGGTCPVSFVSSTVLLRPFTNTDALQPMTVRDFMTYLIYVEHAAENLQFWLWYKDYEKRFNGADTADIRLAPEWTEAMQQETVAKIRKENVDNVRREPKAAEIFKGTDFEKGGDRVVDGNPFHTPPSSSRGEDSSMYIASNAPLSTNASSYQTQASEAFQAAGISQPCKCAIFVKMC
jgi:hypothetical protein